MRKPSLILLFIVGTFSGGFVLREYITREGRKPAGTIDEGVTPGAMVGISGETGSVGTGDRTATSILSRIRLSPYRTDRLAAAGIVGTLTLGEATTILGELIAIPGADESSDDRDGDAVRVLAQQLLWRIFRDDRTAALAAILDPESIADDDILNAVVGTWFREDPHGLLNQLAQFQPGDRLAQRLRRCLDKCCVDDPSGTLLSAVVEWLSANPGVLAGVDGAVLQRNWQLKFAPAEYLDSIRPPAEGDARSLLPGIKSSLSRLDYRRGDVRKAVVDLATRFTGIGREELEVAAGFKWVEQDPKSCVEWLRTTSRQTQSAVLTQFLVSEENRMTDETRIDTAKLLKEIPIEPGAAGLYARAAQKILDREGREAAREWINAIPQEILRTEADYFWRSVLKGGSADDATTFLDSDNVNESPGAVAMAAEILRESGAGDPTNAIDAWMGIGDRRMQDVFMRELGSHLSVEELRNLRSNVDSDDRREVIDTAIIRHVASLAEDVPAAQAAADQLPEPLRTTSMLEVARWVLNPAEGSRVFSETLSHAEGIAESPAAIKSVSSIAVAYVHGDSDAAGSWVSSLPQGAIRDAATSALVGEWAGYDPPAASEWLAHEPPSAGRDHAVASLVPLIRDDPERAIAWAETIGDPSLRLTAVESSVKEWIEIDPSAGVNALFNTGLSDDEKQAIAARLGLNDAKGGTR